MSPRTPAKRSPSDSPTRAQGKGDAKRKRGEDGRYATKLTREVLQRFEVAMAGGTPPIKAAPFAGISVSTYHHWLQLGRMDDAEPIYREFCDAIDQAVSTWATGMMTEVTRRFKNGEGSIKEAVEVLERRGILPGRAIRTELANADDQPFKVLAGNIDLTRLSEMTDEEVFTLQALLHRLDPNAAAGDNGGGGVVPLAIEKEANGDAQATEAVDAAGD